MKTRDLQNPIIIINHYGKPGTLDGIDAYRGDVSSYASLPLVKMLARRMCMHGCDDTTCAVQRVLTSY